jgi:hypothetical protein
MARFILLTIIGFIVITFLSTALKGAVRRMMNSRAPEQKPPEQKPPDASPRVLYRKGDVTVLDGKPSSSE